MIIGAHLAAVFFVLVSIRTGCRPHPEVRRGTWCFGARDFR